MNEPPRSPHHLHANKHAAATCQLCLSEPAAPAPLAPLARDSCGFLERLGAVMRDAQVQAFFQDYFATWSDGKAALMLIHAYVAIEQVLVRDGIRATSDEIVALVRLAVADKDTRKLLVDAMQHYVSDNNTRFVEAVQRVVQASHLLLVANSGSATSSPTKPPPPECVARADLACNTVDAKCVLTFVDAQNGCAGTGGAVDIGGGAAGIGIIGTAPALRM